MDAFGNILSTLTEGIQYSLPLSWSDFIPLLIIVVLLLCSAFMSSSEVAFFSLSPQEVQEIQSERHPNDPKLLHLLSHSEQLLATILIGNNTVNVAITILTGWFIMQHWDFSGAPVMGFVIQTVLITFLLLLFGEIIPKTYAQRRPLAFIRIVAPSIMVVFRVLHRATYGLMWTRKLVKWIHFGRQLRQEMSVDDLSQAVALTTGTSEEEKEMIQEIVKFYNKTADEVMIPRIDMTDIDYQWGYRQVLSYAIETGYSRIPVYEGTADSIRGILYVKDLLPHMHEEDSFSWQKLIRPAYFVPESKKVDDLLCELQKERIHMAIVVDEFGGTCGLITLEDILEEIVGEIIDEYDEREPLYVRVDDYTYMIKGSTPLEEILDFLNLPDDYFAPYDDTIDTLGGLFLEILEEIPQMGQAIHYRELDLTITRMDRHRILQIKLHYSPNICVSA